jgi:hypothetical protein
MGTKQARRHVAKTVGVIGAVAVIAFVVLLTVVRLNAWSNRTDQYTCERCGLKRETYQRWVFLVSVEKRESLEDTPVSRVLSDDGEPCRHAWLHAYLDFHSPRETGHGRFYYLGQLLRDDPAVAQDLAAVARGDLTKARELWSKVFALTEDMSSPQCVALIQWWEAGPSREPLPAWFAEFSRRNEGTGAPRRRHQRALPEGQ